MKLLLELVFLVILGFAAVLFIPPTAVDNYLVPLYEKVTGKKIESKSGLEKYARLYDEADQPITVNIDEIINSLRGKIASGQRQSKKIAELESPKIPKTLPKSSPSSERPQKEVTSRKSALSKARKKPRPKLAIDLDALERNLPIVSRPKIVMAAIDCNAPAVINLVKSGADVNVRDSFGNTALIWSARLNCTPVAKVLLDTRKVTNAPTPNGYYPSDWAERSGHYELAVLLKKSFGK